MKESRYQEIASLCDIFDDLPDAAFLAVLLERGVDADDLYQYSKESDRREAKKRSSLRTAKRARS